MQRMKVRPVAMARAVILTVAISCIGGCVYFGIFGHSGTAKNKQELLRVYQASDPEVERQAEAGQQLEVNSDLVIRVVGAVEAERCQILRRNGVQDKAEPIVNRTELGRIAQAIEKSNGLAILVVPGVGFRQVDSNLVRMMKTNGFSSVRVLAERWGKRFPVPEEKGP